MCVWCGIDAENNLLLVHGAVPGPNGGYVMISETNKCRCIRRDSVHDELFTTIRIMASLTVYNRSGNEVGKYEIEPTDLAPRINKQLLHDVVVMYQSNLRQGTAADQEPRRSCRHDQEDVSPERDRQCPCRLASQRYSSWRRAHLCQASARLDVSPAAQGRAVGHADGAGFEDARQPR